MVPRNCEERDRLLLTLLRKLVGIRGFLLKRIRFDMEKKNWGNKQQLTLLFFYDDRERHMCCLCRGFRAINGNPCSLLMIEQ